MKNKKFLPLFLIWIFPLLHQAQNAKPAFAKGADVGWLPQMEATGYKFYDSDGMP